MNMYHNQSGGKSHKANWWDGKYKINKDGESVKRLGTGQQMSSLAISGAQIAGDMMAAEAEDNAPASVGAQALQYGAMGASLGSVVGPWGTVIGGAAGATFGAVKATGEQKDYQRVKERTKNLRIANEETQGRAMVDIMNNNAYKIYT